MVNFIGSTDIAIFIVVALLLLVLDRIYRINSIKKSFKNPSQCGVGLPPCKFGEKCANGYCIDTNMPVLKPTMLPVFP